MKRVYVALYFAGMIAEVIARSPYDRQRRKIPKADQRVTFVERSLLAGMSVTMLLLPAMYGMTPCLNFANYDWSLATGARVGGGGLAVLAAGIVLFWRSHHDLGTNWSPSLAISGQQTLITFGVCRLIRHPMYASQLLWSVAQALLPHNWIAGLAGFVGFLPVYLVRIPREERMMLDRFGDRYEVYCQQTGRIVPRFRN